MKLFRSYTRRLYGAVTKLCCRFHYILTFSFNLICINLIFRFTFYWYTSHTVDVKAVFRVVFMVLLLSWHEKFFPTYYFSSRYLPFFTVFVYFCVVSEKHTVEWTFPDFFYLLLRLLGFCVHNLMRIYVIVWLNKTNYREISEKFYGDFFRWKWNRFWRKFQGISRGSFNERTMGNHQKINRKELY